ncbi:MAG: malonyl-CoA synthase [Syntrophales bacterium]|jgi:malonyl-CoA/methylmalonyl-CoA synthetase|nr:malonyl-CoA synthase [Syntrophales bacterium]
MNENMYEILQAHFPENPAAPCLILPDGSEISYGRLREESARCANLLLSLGVKPGDRVAVQVRKSPQALFLYLGCLRAGAVYLPMNDAYQRHEVEYFLTDATPRVFVCRPQVRTLANELAEKTGVSHVVELDDDGKGDLAQRAAAQPDQFSTIPRDGDDLAAILYTSGTTGRSKGAMLSHRNLAINAQVLHKYWGFKPGDALLHMLPIFHVHGLFVAIHSSLLNGSPIFFEPKFDVKRALTLLPKATVFMGVPTYYTRLLADPGFTKKLCSGMRLFISGSAPLLLETFQEFQKRIGHTILERYGMTEGNMFTSNPYNGERRGGTVGFPLPEVSIRIVDEENRPVATDEVGSIQVKGKSIFLGYWKMPEKTKEEFTVDGFFKTGDMGKIDKDGYISISGRAKDLVISGGLNIYPKEIEEMIDMLPGVTESAVIGVPHADFGEAVVAVVIRQNNETGLALTEAGIIASLKGELAGFKVPKRVYFLDALPRNAMGKIQKKALREMYS